MSSNYAGTSFRIKLVGLDADLVNIKGWTVLVVVRIFAVRLQFRVAMIGPMR